jgi:hypothetical protein
VDQPEGFNLTGIEVDVDGLAAFRSLLHLELEKNLRPGAQRIINDQMTGLGFGVSSASAAVNYAQDLYLDALSTSMNNLTMYTRIAQVLLDAIHDIIANYSESDLSGEDLLTNIGARMTSANSAALAPTPYRAAL